MKVALRVDLDTFSGTRDGFPSLLDSLRERRARAGFFFCLGPDNMGRHLRRLLKPSFLLKMLRSRAASLYGPEILLRGLLRSGPEISRALTPDLLRRAMDEGHEIGLHGWDHHDWQKRAQNLGRDEVRSLLEKGLSRLEKLSGQKPRGAAAPAWKGTAELLMAEKSLGLGYGSDCRGEGIFLPRLPDGSAGIPQIPVNLPTYDEVIGRDGLGDENYNRFLLDKIAAASYRVLTIHAEVEGKARRELFRDFLARAEAEGIEFVPPGELLPSDPASLPVREMVRGQVPGREGWLALTEIEG